jgi:hypothetical protein
MSREVVFLTHDNASHLFLTEKGQIVGLSSVTRVVITINGTDYDSDDLGATRIWWNEQEVYDEDGELHDVLKFKLGDQAITPGEYINCRVTLYDVSNPNGVVWTDRQEVVAK